MRRLHTEPVKKRENGWTRMRFVLLYALLGTLRRAGVAA